MIRLALRTLGVLCLAVAFVAIVIDGTRSIAGRDVVITEFSKSWGEINQPSLDFVQQNIERQPEQARQVSTALFRQPTFAIFGVLGIVLVLLGRRRHRRHVGFAT